MDPQKGKILILVQNLSYGGVQRSAVNLINNLDYGNIMVVLYDDKADYDYHAEKVSLNSPPASGYLGKVLKFVKRVQMLKKIKKKENAVCTISFADGPNIVNILSRSGDRIIISVHSVKTLVQGVKKVIKFISHFLYRILYRKADVVVCVSEGVRKDMIENFNVPEEKTELIYNSIDIGMIEKSARVPLKNGWKKVFNGKNRVIINTGRLEREKGQWHLIRAFGEVKKNFPDAKMVFLGDGNLGNYLARLSEGIGLEVYSAWKENDRKMEDCDVIFPGFVDNPFNLVAASDIFAFPSLFEGFGLALLEAMACGTPVVSSDYKTGSRELIAPDTDLSGKTAEVEFCRYGILAPVCDGVMYESGDALIEEEKKWVEALMFILTDDEMPKKYRKLEKERAKEFSIDNLSERWKKVIEK